MSVFWIAYRLCSSISTKVLLYEHGLWLAVEWNWTPLTWGPVLLEKTLGWSSAKVGQDPDAARQLQPATSCCLSLRHDLDLSVVTHRAYFACCQSVPILPLLQQVCVLHNWNLYCNVCLVLTTYCIWLVQEISYVTETDKTGLFLWSTRTIYF
jgi:hypothetical protein